MHARTQPHARPLRLGSAEVYTGTCSWTRGFEQWYPPHLRTTSAGRLAYYASRFPAVEIDSTYYALPRPGQTDLLARRTPQGFLFGVKAFGPLTGHPTDPARLPEPARLALPPELRSAERLWPRDLPRETLEVCWDIFRACLAGFEAHGKLGYVLFQFPRWTSFSQGVLRYLEEVRNRLTSQPVAVEWRHRSWWEGPARERMASALRELRMACVVADCPPVEWAPPPEAEVTASWSVIRLHGRNVAGWQRGAGVDAAYDYLYSEEELQEWAARARSLADRVERLFVMFNNCTRGQAAVNAARLVSLFAQHR
jgi:uncharacterized protein YecE (DUF72 family)